MGSASTLEYIVTRRCIMWTLSRPYDGEDLEVAVSRREPQGILEESDLKGVCDLGLKVNPECAND